MNTSRLTSMAQTTIVLMRQPDPAADDPYKAFDEWAGEADTKAYSGL